MNKFNQKIRIGKKLISEKSPAFIIGEIGSNHNLSLKTAKRLIDIAAAAGVDAVKFQSLKFDEQYLESETPGFLKKLHAKIDLAENLFVELAAYSEKKGLVFLSAPTYLLSLAILEKINMAAYKIASPITFGFTSLIAAAAKMKKPLILSAGYCSLKEIDRAVKAVLASGNRQLILLHCVANYPTLAKDASLGFMKNLKERYGCLVGYSDHTMSTVIPAVAVALGARVIEKHFTYSRRAEGPDHSFALEPKELTEMVKNIRQAEQALGFSHKISPFEKKMKKLVMMKLVAAKDIPAEA
ncbi:N-acetylneuraminate synthase family protein, partial [Candidatus Falkowbacteria bacterium]|nr:N-acetylneuraminate synthase family protein [Candidatus Falkowbacteria bacterium]